MLVTGQGTLNQIPVWIRNSTMFTTVVSPGGSSQTSGNALVFVWTIFVVDPNASTDELIHYNSNGVKGSKPLRSGASSGATATSSTSTAANVATIDLSALDQGKYRILDVVFSAL